ncbi:MAG: type II CAAX prenyl endopeptidase Rce1 family protein [Phycisphaeraceae bacterium]
MTRSSKDISTSCSTPPAEPRPSRLAELDRWMHSNPWHPRVLPMIAFLVMLLIIGQGRTHLGLISYPFLYSLQAVIVGWLLWRYRKLTPELTVSFHWLAVPTAILLTAGWIGLGWLMQGEFALRWEAIVAGEPVGKIGAEQGHYFARMADESGGLYWSSLVLRLLGMSLLVPLFEELFVRSACLRGLHSPRKTGLGILQFLEDLPVIGDWTAETKLGRQAGREAPLFTEQLRAWPVGKLTAFGVAASTVIFTINHLFRDWPGAVLCGLVWCWLLWWTNRGGRRMGLGPIVWSHGLTNALLWAYCVWSGDWQFM